MSKSPRTDAVWERFATDTTGELEPDVEFSTLARELEDELNNALEKIKRLEEAGERMVQEPLRKHRRWILNEAKEDKP